MKNVFIQVEERKEKMRNFLKTKLGMEVGEETTQTSMTQVKTGKGSTDVEGGREIYPCKTCGKGIMRVVISKKGLPFLGCSGFPECKTSSFFPRGLSKIRVLEKTCRACSGNLVEFSFVPEVKEKAEEALQGSPICISGCNDAAYKKLMDIRYNESNNWNKQNHKAKKEVSKAEGKKSNKCTICGIVGAHPKGSNCPGKKQRKYKKNQ